MPKQREGKLSKRILDMLRVEGAFAWKVHGSEYQLAGLPDIVACYRGLFLGLEVKNPGNRDGMSPIQRYRADQIRAAGGQCFTVCGVEEVRHVLKFFDDKLDHPGSHKTR